VKDYGAEYPVGRGWFWQYLAYIIFLLSGFGAVVCFCAALLLTIYLLPGAIDAELDRQIAVVERSLGVSK
jgi:hypothetical protein